MSDIIRMVRESILEKRLFCQGEKILVAVSGGLDSMVLLHLLHGLSEQNNWKLSVVHFNHQLRASSSDGDERFVQKAAQGCGLPFVSGRADVRSWARRQKLSLEMAARDLRHKFFVRVAQGKKASVIALGHHADDQVELFFLRLLRGAGSEGLSGMKWHGPSPGNSKLALARPLLGCSRKEIQQFASREKILFREDQTNAALKFLRNRLRHQVLPLLVKHFQPALGQTTLRLMEVLEAESEFVAQSAAAWLENKQTPFAQLPIAIQRRALQRQLFSLHLDADFKTVEHLRLREGWRLTISPGRTIHRDGEGLLRMGTTVKPQFKSARLEMKLRGKLGSAKFGLRKITWQIEAHRRSEKCQKVPGREFFNAEKVGSTIALRHWQPGDRFQPIGLKTSVKLQDLLSNQKIQREQRHELIVATAANGELFWVEGLRISEQFKLDKGTVRRLNWGWQPC